MSSTLFRSPPKTSVERGDNCCKNQTKLFFPALRTVLLLRGKRRDGGFQVDFRHLDDLQKNSLKPPIRANSPNLFRCFGTPRRSIRANIVWQSFIDVPLARKLLFKGDVTGVRRIQKLKASFRNFSSQLDL